jgi:KaiC/GvpD/RAD55 family RecA-like ATPase
MTTDGRYDVSGVLPVSGFDAGTSILVSGPAGSGKTYLGARILAGADSGGEGALAVTTDGNAAEILEAYREGGGGDALHFIDCSGAAARPPPEVPPERFESVGSPSDMTGVGVAFEKYAKKVGGSADGNRVMYDSLTTLLQYVDRRRAYRFVDVLTGRLRAQGALSVFTVDRGAVGEKASSMLVHEFDAEVRLRVEDGVREASVRGVADISEDWVRVE